MPSKEVADLTHDGGLTGAEELHLVAGVVRDGGGNVTDHGNSRRATLTEILALVPNAISQAFADGRYLQKANNLSDLVSALTARANLGLGSAATFAASALLQVANNLSDVTNVVTARTNLSVYSKAEVDAAIAGATPTGMPFEIAVTKPVAANFTLLNGAAGTNPAVMADYGKGVSVYQALTAGGAQIRFACSNTAPGATLTLTGRFHQINPLDTTAQATSGLILRNSANGRMIMWAIGGTAATIYGQIFSGYTSGQLGQYTAAGLAALFPWLRITIDGAGTLRFLVSRDGYFWIDVGGSTVGNYIGAVDQVGFGQQVLTSPVGVMCQSYTQTA